MPNNQAIKVVGGTLIETGNKNLFANASFEAPSAAPWTTIGTVSFSTSIRQDGKQSIVLTRATSGPISLSQDVSTTYLSGQQGFASCRVRTNQSDIRICPTVDAATDTANCIDVEPSASFALYEIPFLLGATSSGVIVESTVNGTGNTFVDDCYVGIKSPSLADVAQIGPWISYTPTFTGFGTPTNVEFQYRINGSNIDIRGKFVSDTSTGVEARASLPSGFTSATTATIPSLQVSGVWGRGAVTTNHGGFVFIEPSVSYVTFSSTDVFSGGSTNALSKSLANNMVSSGNTLAFEASIPVQGLSNKITTYSQQCVNDRQCENTFTFYYNGTTVVDQFGNNYTVTKSGTNNNLKDINITPLGLTQTMRCSSASSDAAGSFIVGFINATASNLVVSTTTPSVFVDLGFTITCTKQGADYKAKNVITGSFQDVVTSPGAGRPVLCSAKISSTGVISDQLGGCFASCTNATTPVCTFTTSFWRSGTIPNCWTQALAASYNGGSTTLTTTQFAAFNLNDTGGAVAGNRIYFCQGVQ